MTPDLPLAHMYSWRYRFVVLTSDAPNDVSLKQGGTQIEYEDEDKEIHEIFEEGLSKAGARCRMESMVPWCSQRE